MSLPSPIIVVLAHFEPLFTAPTWKKVMTLLVGTDARTRSSYGDGGTAADGPRDECTVQRVCITCSIVRAGRRLK